MADRKVYLDNLPNHLVVNDVVAVDENIAELNDLPMFRDLRG
jgi:hypothetical protein